MAIAVPFDFVRFLVVDRYENRVARVFHELADAAQWVESRGRWRRLYRVVGQHNGKLTVLYEAPQ